MSKKKRLPIGQLRAAGRVAREMLVKRGIISEESLLDQIMKMENSPNLPGIPSYLPHQWTLKASQRIMYDLAIMWKVECNDNEEKAENLTKFFAFIVKNLRSMEKEYAKEEKAMGKSIKGMEDVPVLKDIFAPSRKKENINAIHRFFVDSFAVAIILKNNDSTSSYLNWFLDWTQDLYALWVKPDDRKTLARV
jgi:hypothetical protein